MGFALLAFCVVWGSQRLFEGRSMALQVGAALGSVGVLAVVSGAILHRLRGGMTGNLHQVHEASGETRQYLAGFFDQLPIAVMILDAAGRVRNCNRLSIQMLGIPESLIRSTDWTRPGFPIIQADGNSFTPEEQLVPRVLAGRERVEGLVMGLEGPDGDWNWVSATAEPRFAAQDELQDIIVILEDITRRRSMEAELTVQTFRDALTGLPNRTLFMERLHQALIRLERRHTAVAVLFLDLDQFKVVNDSLSFEQGDRLLVQVARRLQSVLRPQDTVARLGGDDFVVLFEELGAASDAMRVAERIRQAFLEPFLLNGQEVYASCSMGLALTSEADTVSSELLRDAEVAMYRAKAQAAGESTIEIFDPSMNRQALQRLQLEADLRRALERGEFLLHYQPLVGLSSGRIEGWESLVRWQHPERGMVPPLSFIPLTEENGMIVPLGKWILEEACRQASRWHQRFPNYPPRLMNVNISGRQFQASGLIDTVREALDAHQMAPSLLKLEITESVMMMDSKATLEVMRVFRSLDIHLVIDDFGTGYSSLSYLRRFPVDTLKVDKSFVDGLGQDSESTAIVQAIISLARALGMRVVAEGIETAEQFAQLRKLGCDQGQGYFFSRPLPPEQAEDLLARNPLWEPLPMAGEAD